MNFLDPLDIASAGATSSTPPPTAQPEQSLNEEVTQVLGQLNRFWGGFRKQSETAMAIARKDFSEVVTQAQAQMHRYSESAATTTTTATTTATQDVDSEETPPASSSTEQAPSSLFSRIQAALPPTIATTVQNNIPESLKNPDFAQIRHTLATEFQRVQGVTRAQAEEYVHKSEALLREAVKEAGEVLKDAVKVIPPDEAGSSGLIWDGSDMWMLPTPMSTPEAGPSSSPSDKGKGKASSTHAVATRAEALLKRLKHDSDIIRHDPEADATTKEQYLLWTETEVEAEGGIEGDVWKKRQTDALADAADGAALKANVDTLVPDEMTLETFWTRYFFRAHQISQEEERRKALIQGSLSSDEDFSWEEDEDEEETKATTPSASMSTVGPAENKTPTKTVSQTPTPATSSPRESSEDSYDVVSSGNVSEARTGESKNTKEGESDDGDSDWE